MKPYRFSPPTRSLSKIVERSRLLDALDGRFERRLTFVQGGAGFGKTTLLVDALERNLVDPAGIDIWLGLSAEDDRLGEFVSGLRRALRIEGADGDDLEQIVNAVWRESPKDIVLVLDDAHHLSLDGEANVFLEKLLDSLPANGHLVLASREAPGFPITRLLASADACIIEEPELAFDETERARFLGVRGVDRPKRDWGGWPALLELAASAQVERADDFVWEEVLSRLPDSSTRALARLAPLDWVDAERIRAVAGVEMSAADLLQGLPLVSRGPDGVARLHGLWRPFLEQIDPAWLDGEFDQAIEFLCASSEFRDAMRMCNAFDRGDRIEDVVRAFVGVFDWARFEAAEIEALLSLMPASHLQSGPGLVLDGLLRLHTQPTSAVGPLIRAREMLNEQGEASIELAALSALGLLAFFGSQVDSLRQFVEIGASVEHPLQPATTKLGLATIAVLEGRPEEALELTDELTDQGHDLGNLDHAGAAIAALDAGRPEIALARVDAGTRRIARMVQPSLLNSQHDARWFEGALDEPALAEFDGALQAEVGGHRHNTTVFHAVLGFQNALLGRIEASFAHCDFAETRADPSFGPRPAMAIATAKAACAAGKGDEPTASRILEEALKTHRADGLIHRHTLRAIGIIYALVPSARVEIEGWKLGPCYRRGLSAAQALVAIRENGDTAPAGALDWTEAVRFQIFLTLDMNLELAVAAVAEGCDEAMSQANALAASQRSALRAFVASEDASASKPPPRFAAAVKELLARVPARPSEDTVISVLGSLEVRRNGRLVDDPSLRRSRVRDLLHFLIAHPNASRVEVAAALWPDMDSKTAANNVRVNLSHLLRVLEPDRKGNEPSYLASLEGSRIGLRPGDALAIDALQFDALLDRARQLEKSGDVGAALELYRESVELYRGDYLVDASDPQWGEFERTRLRSRYLAAATRTASLLLGKGEFKSALDLAREVLAIDDLHEGAYRVQALVYFRQGDRAAARSVLEAGRTRFVEAGIEPDGEFLRLLRRAGEWAVAATSP